MTLVNPPVEVLTLIVNLIIPESWNESTDGCLLKLRCQGGKDPLYTEEGGWRDWHKDAKEEQVLKWLKELVDKLLESAKGSEPVPNIQRRPLALLPALS